MTALLTRFRKTFFFPWSFKKWEARFLALSPLQQTAFVYLVEDHVAPWFAYNAIVKTDDGTLSSQFDNILADINMKYAADVVGW